MFEIVKNVSIIRGEAYSKIIIGDQVFDLPNDVLAKFIKLDLLLSPDLVFKHDVSDSAYSFLSYEAAKDLCIFLVKSGQDQDLLENYSQDQLINIVYLAEYLGLQDLSILKPIITKFKLNTKYNSI